MYVAGWPSLNPGWFFETKSPEQKPFPLSAANRHYFYVARNGIYHLFRALRFKKGETVLVPDYHSGNEVWAIRAAGASVVYYHINRNLEPDLAELEQLCRTHNPKALYVIHFLGWPQPMAPLTELCRQRKLLLIEDCALSLLSESGGKALGSFGDYAVFCLYKTLPVPNGGLIVQNHNMVELNGLDLQACSKLSVAGRSAGLMMEWIRGRSEPVGNALFTIKGSAGRALSKMRVSRVPVGDIGFDVSKVNLGMSSFCHGLLKRFDYEGIRRKRRENYMLLHQMLAGKTTLLLDDLGDACPLFFPFLVSDKGAAARALWSKDIDAVEFWNYGDPEAKNPSRDSQFLREHVLELPIHQDVTHAQLEYMANEVMRLNLHL